jgi:hypothetical protein
MSGQIFQHRFSQIAAFMAALMLLLPPLPGRACACWVKSGDHATCSHCSRRIDNASPQVVRSCCAKHRDAPRMTCCQRRAALAQESSTERVVPGSQCHCHHGQTPQQPVAPASQSQLTFDQLLQLQVAVSQPLLVTSPPWTSFSAYHGGFLLADTSLERCILLSRWTL